MVNKTSPKSRTGNKATEKTVRDPKKLALSRQLKIQRALYEIADAASAVTDMQAFYIALHRIVGKLMYARNFYVTLYDPVTEMISAPYFADESGDLLPPPARLDRSNKSLRGIVLHTGKTLHVSAEEIEDARKRGELTPMGTPAEDWIGVPLKIDGQVIGSLTVQSYRKGIRYGESDVQLLEFVAQHIAVALTRARAMEETRQRNAELAIINSVQEGLAYRLDMQGIYDLVGEKIRTTFKAQVVSIATYDRAAQLMHGRYYFEEGKQQPGITLPIFGFRKQVIENCKPILINQDMPRWMEEYGNPVIQGLQPKSAVFIPMMVGDEAMGVISLQNNDQENAFTEADLRLLTTLASSMSVALENARLFGETQRLLKETQQRNAELAIINSVQAGLASQLHIQGIYELVGDKIREIFDANTVVLATFDLTKNLMFRHYVIERGVRYQVDPTPIPAIWHQFIQQGQSTLINNSLLESMRRIDPAFEAIVGEIPKCALSVPLRIQGQVHGVISLQNVDRENAFSESDMRLLETLANSLSVALENARLFDETEHRAQEFATINTVSAALAGELDLNTLIELVGEQVRSVFKADIAFVALLDKEKSLFSFPYQYGQQLQPIRLGQGLTSKIIQSGQPLLINEDMDRQRQQMKVKLIGERARSFLGVPIFVAGEAIGVVSVQSTKQEGRFTEDDQRLLSTIAANVGIAFQNARLFHETQRLFQAERQAHEQAETLRSVAQALNRSLSLAEVFQLVLTEIQKVIPYDSAGIYQVHGNRRVLVAGRGFANLEDLIGLSFKFNRQEDEIGYLISRSLQPLILDDAPETYPQYFSTGSHAATRIRSYMAVPIVLNQKLIGMITLDREKPGFYTDEHAGLAMAFAAQAATAINNAQLFDEAQQRNAELAIINSVQAGLASQLDIQGIYDLVGDKIREIFDANTVALATFDLQRGLMHRHYIIERGVRYYVDPAPISDIWRQFIQRGQSAWINRNFLRRMRRIEPEYRVPIGQVPKSVLSVPLRLQGETRGVISLQNVDRENAFSQSDVRLLETLANSMSVALDNARLWEQEKLYRKALERELEIGREIQAGFLPEVLPQVKGWEVATALMSAREVAGDFYDVFELPDGHIGLVIADVCDKGVGAALFMTLFRSLIRITANQEAFEPNEGVNTFHSTTERLQRAMLLTNNYIAETHQDSGMFATLFFGILNPRDGQLAYINGGHEPPLIMRSGIVRESLRKTGPAVGAIPNGHFAVHVVQMNPGEIFFAFTDGAPEAKDSQGEFFGHERIHEILRQRSRSSHELVKTVEAKLRQHIGCATQFDDITLLAVRRAH